MWLPLATAFAASATALLVAFVAYAWQKKIDRQSAILADRRKLYAEYIASAKRLYLSQPFADGNDPPEKQSDWLGMSKAEVELYVLRDQIFLLAPPSTVNAVVKHDESFRKWKICFSNFSKGDAEKVQLEEEYRAMRADYLSMLKVMRQELETHAAQPIMKLLSKAKP
jgi:hypothetical protein